MKDPLITTVIPTYKRPEFLKRAVESVLSQSFRNLRVCIYDNASGDATEDAVKEMIRHDDRVSYTKHTDNIGPIQNIIQGIEAVSTEFYSLFSDDDFLLPGFYESAMHEFSHHPSAGFVCAKSLTIDLPRSKMLRRNRDWRPGQYAPSNQVIAKMFSSHFTQTGVLFRESMRQRIGSCERSGNDVLYMTMAAASSPFMVLDLYGAAFLMHPASYSASWRRDPQKLALLQEDYLACVGDIARMDVAADFRFFLLSLAANIYFAIFEADSLSKFQNRNADEAAMPKLPSRVTLAGLALRLYDLFPRRCHFALTPLLNWAMRLRSDDRNRGMAHDWITLPADVSAMLESLDKDVSRIAIHLNRQ